MQRVSRSELEAFCARVFIACGLDAHPAQQAARALCYADTAGLDTHGVVNLERIYVPRLRSGAINPRARPIVEGHVGATMKIDALHALGLFAASMAVEEATEVAKDEGVAFVVVRRSSHLGSAGAYVARCASRGFVALAMSNCGLQRIVPHPAGGAPLLGTNPLAMACPAGRLPPFVLDMSTSVVPTGRIRRASAQHQRLPAGILADNKGNSVTDPAAWERGAAHLLWLGSTIDTGAYKGFGLAILVDLLAGVLPGAGVGPLGAGEGDVDVGHAFLVADPGAFRPDGQFEEHAEAMLRSILNNGGAYPGTREFHTAQRNLKGGIPIAQETAASLRRVAELCRVELPPSVSATSRPQ